MFKKTTSLFLTLVMAGSLLAGCSNGNQNETAATSAPPAAPVEAAATEQAAQDTTSAEVDVTDEYGRYAEEITVTTVLSYNTPGAEVPAEYTPESNEYVRLFKELLNVNLEYLWIVNADQYEAKMGATLASGDLPDIFMPRDEAQYVDLRDQGAFADLNDVYEQYANDNTRAFFEPGVRAVRNREDGGLHALATGGDTTYYSDTGVMFYRKDWLDNLGLEIPVTIDDLENVLAALSEADFGGTGGAVYPANKLFHWQGFVDFTPIFTAYGSYPVNGVWYNNEAGEVVNSMTQDSTLNALTKLNEWYSKGWINKDFASLDVWADGCPVVEDVTAGKYGVVPGSWWVPNWPLNLQKDADPKAEWVAAPIPVVDSANAFVVANPSGDLGTTNVISSKCKNPEALIKMLNVFIDVSLCGDNPDVKGTEKEGWGEARNGYVYNWLPFRAYYGDTLKENYNLVNKLIDEGRDVLNETDEVHNTEFYSLWDNYLKYREDPLNGIAWGMYYSRAAKDGGVGMNYKMQNELKNVTNLYNSGRVYESNVAYGATLDKLKEETFLKMVMGETSLNEWDNFVSQWKSLGGDAIYEEVMQVLAE